MFELMRSMRWTWEQFEATPALVRQICWTFLMTERRIRNSRAEQADRAAGSGADRIRVRR